MQEGMVSGTYPAYQGDQLHGRGKKIWDVIHGYMRFTPKTVEIMDTAEFQRLRSLKQLGIANYVFPTAEHSRFVHSLGVSYLSYQCLDSLRLTQPSLEIRTSDLVCVEVAGLCHDLGHGPLSHVWENDFMPRMARLWGDVGEHWTHEAMSSRYFDHLVDRNSIDLSKDDLRLVHDMMAGRRNSQAPAPPLSGRQADTCSSSDGDERRFLLQIVANQDSGVDVDKIDYLRRDSRACGIGDLNFTQLLDNTRVIDGHICYADSMQHKLTYLFNARATMHGEVYTHRKSKCFEYMLLDALTAAAVQLNLWDRVRDLDLFTGLDDSVVAEIEHHASPDAGMKQAQDIMRRMRRRQLYRWCAEAVVPSALFSEWRDLSEADVVSCQDHNCGIQLQADDVIVQNLNIHHGRGQANPLDNVRLYAPTKRSLWFPATAAHTFVAASCAQRKVRVYLRKVVPSAEQGRHERAVQAAFQRCMRARLGPDAPIALSRADGEED